MAAPESCFHPFGNWLHHAGNLDHPFESLLHPSENSRPETGLAGGAHLRTAEVEAAAMMVAVEVAAEVGVGVRSFRH